MSEQTEKKIARKILSIITQKRDECYIRESIPHNVVNKGYHYGGRCTLNDVEKEIREKFDLRKRKNKIEGLVIKNYNKQLFGKWINDEFEDKIKESKNHD